MGVRNGGTGDLELVTLGGNPPYSGSNAVEYLITTPFGAFEEGTGAVVSGFLRSRVVTSSSNSDAAINVPIPTRGVVVYLNAQVPAASSGGGGGSFEDGDYGGIVVSGGGTVVTIGEDAVTAGTIPDGEITADKLANGVVQTTAELQDDLGVPNTLGKRCELVYQFVGIANSTQVLDPKATFPYTIAKLNHEGSEALTANVRIGSTSVTGLSAVAVTTSNADSTATAANVVAIGDRVTVIFTDIATTANVMLKLVVDRD
jgi:hypothetical protein